MKGRKPKDIAMRLLNGNAGKRPLNGSASADPFVRERVREPNGLSDLEAQEWRRLAETLAPILSRASEGMLLIAAQAFGQMMVADQIVREKGMFYETCGEAGTVIRQHPAVKVREVARTAYHRALEALGGSPAALAHVRRLSDEKTAKAKAAGTGAFFT